jgi:hypothetical protein
MSLRSVVAIFVFFAIDGASATTCPRFSIDYFPSQFKIEGPLSVGQLKKVATCSFEMESCAINTMYDWPPESKKPLQMNAQILVRRISDNSSRVITRDGDVASEGFRVEILNRTAFEKLLGEIVRKGDACTVEARYKRMCAGREGMSKNLKKVCKSLRSGKLEGSIHVEVPRE